MTRRDAPRAGQGAQSGAPGAGNGEEGGGGVAPHVTPPAGDGASAAARRARFAPRALLAVLILTAALACAYSAFMPLGAAPDEGAHLQYVRVLAHEGRLPALNISQRRASHADPDYESHQAPLYYAICVPFFRVGEAVAGETGAGQACRAVSILIGLLATWLIWLLAREIAPHRPDWGLTATALAGFLPMRLSVLASVSNDTLAEAASSLALLVMVRAVKGDWGFRQAGILGGALALALLSKQNTFLLFPPALVAVYLATAGGVGNTGRQGIGSQEQSVEPEPHPPDCGPAHGISGREHAGGWAPREPGCGPGGVSAEQAAGEVRRFFATGFVTLGVTLALAGWWFVRNQVLYGDPLGLRVFNWYFADTPLWADFRDRQGMAFGTYLFDKVFPTTFASFWGAFGHLDPQHPEWFMGFYRRPDVPEWARLWMSPLELFWPFHTYPPRSWVYPLLMAAVAASFLGWGRVYLRWRTENGTQGAASGERGRGRGAPGGERRQSGTARAGRRAPGASRRGAGGARRGTPSESETLPLGTPHSPLPAGALVLALHCIFVAAEIGRAHV